MGLTRYSSRHVAAVLVLLGGLLVTVGAALVYLPAGFIVSGLALGALGYGELRR